MRPIEIDKVARTGRARSPGAVDSDVPTILPTITLSPAGEPERPSRAPPSARRHLSSLMLITSTRPTKRSMSDCTCTLSSARADGRTQTIEVRDPWPSGTVARRAAHARATSVGTQRRERFAGKSLVRVDAHPGVGSGRAHGTHPLRVPSISQQLQLQGTRLRRGSREGRHGAGIVGTQGEGGQQRSVRPSARPSARPAGAPAWPPGPTMRNRARYAAPPGAMASCSSSRDPIRSLAANCSTSAAMLFAVSPR